ncbi:uncharacterized protein LOC114916527 isoform X1 [Cajanus cajan]|uniref:uncharacterized protein LOC114916527 isoform X1 n=1 Tax=Cajanus cajan TaxID=3821 RepID=UPI0010FB6711|nr:uncharacterized protein LOC114916527 isoform X1 [Cajanus cajan]
MILVAIQAFTGTNFHFSDYSSSLKSVLATASNIGKLFEKDAGARSSDIATIVQDCLSIYGHTSMKSFHKLSCWLLKKLLLFHCWWFEGTGCSLLLKLLHQLELQSSMSSKSIEGTGSVLVLIFATSFKTSP